MLHLPLVSGRGGLGGLVRERPSSVDVLGVISEVTVCVYRFTPSVLVVVPLESSAEWAPAVDAVGSMEGLREGEAPRLLLPEVKVEELAESVL